MLPPPDLGLHEWVFLVFCMEKTPPSSIFHQITGPVSAGGT